MLYITVSKREAATPFILTALPLHRIFKVQFHTISVGVSVRGILKKKAIKCAARSKANNDKRERKKEREKGEDSRAESERNCEEVDRSRKSGTMTVPLSTLRAIIIHYATRASREIARGSARVRVLVRGLVELQIQVGGGEETREDRATGGWPGSRTR